MAKPTDVRPKAAALWFLPVRTRVPLKFGAETLTSVTCARVRLRVEDKRGRGAEGWGETPLSVQWVWPSRLSYEERHDALKEFTRRLVKAWAGFDVSGHPIEIGRAFIEGRLRELLDGFNGERGGEPMPWLAALVCCSAFDIALHDAFGRLHNVYVYDTYNAGYMSADLGHFLAPAGSSDVEFTGLYPDRFLVSPRPDRLPAWHLVGGKDWIDDAERDGSEPKDGYPVLLRDWIRADGLKCLKVKLRGNDPEWDYERLARVGRIAVEEGAHWISTDFNATVSDPGYVNGILDRLLIEEPRIYGMILYVEQPFPYELEAHRIDVHSVSARKPLFMDESAHDWRLVRIGRELGWTGVALKTCKTQTGALLALCWAKAHGMTIMVQDLTNPMIAQIPHCLLAAHAGTIMGVETNAMQFYPEASLPEARIHPGVYQRRRGEVDLATLDGPGFAYGAAVTARELGEPAEARE
ncbi:MAG TPA: mandelate racemase/muconate lactonizing enzyme family protein [Candidatus Hydrogenedentes bacterium]|nr:mandelate racemase/muconate lactonizing enzyme family protein [Candidatus Hydrogenedentota bacterium]